MKHHDSLFPSYYFRDDDAAVFLESDHWNDSTIAVRTPGQTDEVSFGTITGSTELVNLLRRAKAVSSSFGRKKFEELRGKTNYYEGLGKGCFLNRSAMKLVNLDYVFSLIEPTLASYATSANEKRNGAEPRTDNGGSLEQLAVRPHFSFVDLCGGPGGFIECIVLKCRFLGIAVTGFGMTLLIGNEEPGFRGIMKACNWNIFHLQDPPYSEILSDQKESSEELREENNMVMKCLESDETNRGDYLVQNSDMFEKKEIRSISEVSSVGVVRGERECVRGRGRESKSECRVILVGGATGTGDICEKTNLNSLQSLLQLELPILEIKESNEIEDDYTNDEKHKEEQSDNDANKHMNKDDEKDRKYVSFVCSDGFDHETEAFRIVLCQVIGMIKTLKVGGNFIMKVFSCTKVCFRFFVLPFLQLSPHTILFYSILFYSILYCGPKLNLYSYLFKQCNLILSHSR